MKRVQHLKIIRIATALFVFFGIISPINLFAATSPSLGAASTYGIVSSTFTRNIGVTAITGNVGYTTLSGGGSNTVSGITSTPATVQSGIDQGAALAALAAQTCTWTSPGGPIDLSTDGPAGGVYTPGVYCITAAASIGTGGITLNGAGTYIFRVSGAFTTVNNSVVTLNGASACDVFWTATSATTLGANTTFVGTVIDDSGITVGSTTAWSGRALAYGGTVTTDTDTISVPVCAVTTLKIVKNVINGPAGTAVPADFTLHVKNVGIDVLGSPAAGTTTPGTSYLISAGTYQVSENATTSYNRVFSGDCDTLGNVTLLSGETKTCIVTNSHILVPLSNNGGGLYFLGGCKDPKARNFDSWVTLDNGSCVYDIQIANTAIGLIKIVKVPSRLTPFGYGGGNVTYTYTITNPGTSPISNVVVSDDKCTTVSRVSGDTNNNNLLDTNEQWVYTCQMNIVISTRNIATVQGIANGVSLVGYAFATVLVGTPGLPNAGFPPVRTDILLEILIIIGIVTVLSLLNTLYKKRAQ